MLLDRGRPEDDARARTMLDAALERYTTIGMPLHAKMAREQLSRL